MYNTRYGNWKFHVTVISIIIILAGINHIVTQYDFEDKDLYVNISLILSIVAAIIVLTVIVRRYQSQKETKVAFLFLLVAHIAYLFGELSWFVYETVLNLEPYPSSVADVGFLNYFILSDIFLIAIIRRHTKLTIHNVGYAVLLISILTTIYLFVSINDDADYFYVLFGLPFVLSASTMFALSCIALYKFRSTPTYLAWIILFTSFLVTTIADLWYYSAENFGQYTYDHIMNTMWVASLGLLVYGLLMYRKAL